ncbi:hypothetical protein FGO68_gene8943 [Halteria grandinella]|uniref:Uncharacterized protein n=1 Tax=Halteria grandinella TaxID=5974 RepID=A0A8J8NT55_HALGN|nr:hypothetical protein FGO68_gene8943 [Halteria grandinella]
MQFCRCKRGELLKYYCAQSNCIKHKDDLYFCEKCAERGHVYNLISQLMVECRSKWDALIEIEEKSYAEITSQYAKQSAVIEYIDAYAQTVPWFTGHLLSKEMLKFNQFHSNFLAFLDCNHLKLTAIRQLHRMLERCTSFSQSLNKHLSNLGNLSRPDFVFQNYAPCIVTCPISLDPADSLSRMEILAMKVRLENKKLAVISNMKAAKLNPQDICETVASLRNMVVKQEAQMSAFMSLVGSLEGAARLICMCVDGKRNNGEEGDPKVKKEIESKISEIKQAIDSKLDQRDFMKFKRDVEDQMKSLLDSLNKQSQQLDPLEWCALQNQPELQSSLYSSQQLPRILRSPRLGQSALSFKRIIARSPPFSQEMLDRMISTFNRPFNGYTPRLNAEGHSKIAEHIINQRWNWSIEYLNATADINNPAQQGQFEGAIRGNGWTTLKEGVYYGQMLNGYREGFGILYCTDTENNPWLYECQWKQGRPSGKGRYTWVWQNQWRKCRGTLKGYLLEGDGSRREESGYYFKGEFKGGNHPGQVVEGRAAIDHQQISIHL